MTSIRSLSNPYHAVWKRARKLSRSNRASVTLVSEANSEKGISDIRAMIAKTGGNMVLNSTQQHAGRPPHRRSLRES